MLIGFKDTQHGDVALGQFEMWGWKMEVEGLDKNPTTPNIDSLNTNKKSLKTPSKPQQIRSVAKRK